MTTTATSALLSVLIDAKQPDVLSHLSFDGVAPIRAPLAAGSINLIAHDGALLATLLVLALLVFAIVLLLFQLLVLNDNYVICLVKDL